MSIVPISSLSNRERALLGNNIHDQPSRRHRQRRRSRAARVAAVNRSLQAVGEQVRSLHKPLLIAT